MSFELKAYIEKSLSQGRTPDEIKNRLAQSGWSSKVINRILIQYAGVDEDGLPIPAPRLQSHQIAKDLFLYLLVLVTLSLTAFAVGGVFINLVDRAFPDPRNYYYDMQNNSSMSWSIAEIIIAFPIFTWISMIIGKDISVNADKRNSLIRKLLIYAILALSALATIIDLIAILFNFLQGDLTVRFLLKACVILGISLLIFIYYLYEVRRDDALIKDTADVL